ncbi:TIGR03016 family PEP-CTERM system-associated outer membrane protein [Spiribacter vilamensis]|uniref:TIGR03016 family PEP-CTERM system-associated outer membrane protein n=1 Tax=Spiribacter vilamensis TaxID=531306 RepID=UPI0013EE60C0|nr:TIGR03016 family PEP-CTERM system-associated outer membrane protein [Spiribacter vilamensis]
MARSADPVLWLWSARWSRIVTRTAAVVVLIVSIQPAVGQSLDGCGLPLPGGADRDSGLGERTIQNRQGQRFLLAPSLTARHTTTDNVALTPDGEKESSNVSEIVPAFTFCQNRPGLRTQIDYRAELLYYSDDTNRNDVRHQLNASNTAELADNTAFLDLDAQFDQRPLSVSEAFGGNRGLDTGNTEDVLDLRASPYINQDLGPAGSMQARYAFETTDHEERKDRDTDRHIGSVRLASPAAADPVSWLGSIRSERIERDESSASDETSYLDNAFVELGYRVRGRLTLTARSGLETENLPDGGYDRFGSEYWEAGGRWSNDRTRIEARFGKRFFDDTYFAAINHRAGRITGNLSYQEVQDVRADEDNPEPDVALSKRLNASASYEKGRSTVTVNVFDDRADFIRSGEERDRIGVDTRWRWQFQPRTTLTPSLDWQQLDDRNGIDNDIYGARISLTRLLSPEMQAGVTLRREERDSDDPSVEYRENAITLEITRVF